MPTLRFPPDFDDLAPEERAILERVAKRRGTTAERLVSSGIYGAQSHWPALLEANLNVAAQTFMRVGQLPELTKQAMHVAVSMSNGCEY